MSNSFTHTHTHTKKIEKSFIWLLPPIKTVHALLDIKVVQNKCWNWQVLYGCFKLFVVVMVVNVRLVRDQGIHLKMVVEIFCLYFETNIMCMILNSIAYDQYRYCSRAMEDSPPPPHSSSQTYPQKNVEEGKKIPNVTNCSYSLLLWNSENNRGKPHNSPWNIL